MKKTPKILKIFQEYQDANNFIILKTLPFKDDAKRKKCIEEIVLIDEFKFFSKKKDIRKQYKSLIKSIKRYLFKNNIISKEHCKSFNYKNLQNEIEVKYTYTINKMKYTFT